MTRKRIGYMDATNFYHELGEAPGGTLIFKSAKEVLEYTPCAHECGVVRVEVTKDTDITHSNFDSDYKQEHRPPYLKERLEAALRVVDILKKEIAEIEKEKA